ncbi:MAG: hypothetical protein ACRDDY_00870 [Clostridium sp.]|uniref:hypothetical protein n=1 Tax=Clostridium sp. TaxID=1506 RepID=UPI003EE431AF
MNKLEVLYRMSKTMKEKNVIKGNVSVVGENAQGEFLKGTNNFCKDIENRKMSVDANIMVNTEELQVSKQIKKDLDFEKMKGHHHHHHHHGEGCKRKCKGNKFAKLEVLFKVLNDMELTENDNEKIIEVDVKEILMKKIEKMKEMHKNMEGKGCKIEDIECEDLKEMFKIKHAIFNELCKDGCNCDKVILKLTMNKDFEITNVEVKGTGSKNIHVNVSLSY